MRGLRPALRAVGAVEQFGDVRGHVAVGRVGARRRKLDLLRSDSHSCQHTIVFRNVVRPTSFRIGLIQRQLQ